MAEGARLESVYTGNRIVGSNPTLSAIHHSSSAARVQSSASARTRSVHSPCSLCARSKHRTRSQRLLATTHDVFGTQFRYLKVIKSVRLRVEALVFKGSLVEFELF